MSIYTDNMYDRVIEYYTISLREATKKKSSTNGRAIKKKGGGGKGRAIKEKRTFFNFLFILLPFKDKNYFTLDNLSKFGHLNVKVCR